MSIEQAAIRLPCEAGPNLAKKQTMKHQFLVAIHHPKGYDGSTEDAQMGKDIDDLNDAMVAAGIRLFVGGLQAPEGAKSISRANGELSVTDGPYLETKEHIGGFWVLGCEDMDEAVEWGRRAAAACRAPVEVRQFFPIPSES